MGKLYHHIITALFAVAVSMMSGCSQESHPTNPGVYINDKRVVSIHKLELSDPVLYVNGEKITKRDFEALLLLRDRIWRIRQNKAPEASEQELNAFRMYVGDSMLIELIHRAMFRQYAKEIGAEPPPEKVKAAAVELLKLMGRPDSTVENLANLIGGDAGELFRKIPYVDAQDAMLRQSVTTNDLDNVSDAEMKRRVEFVKRFDANAETMNERAKERLLAAKKRILAGADIAEEAKKIFDTVHPEYAKKWGRFEIQEFPADEELHKWLLTAKAGDISEPLDLDDGIAIVKVVEKGKGEAPEGVTPPDAFTLVRCTVKALEKMRYQSPDEMRRQLLFWKRQDAQHKLGTMLTAKAVIEYPNGTNLFAKVTQEGDK